MRRVGVSAGSAYSDLLSGQEAKLERVSTRFGEAHIWLAPLVAFLPRHGVENNIPPHRINHQANMEALKKLGVSQVIGVNCTGSLKRALPPNSIVIPDDYVNFWDIRTIYDEEIRHITPGLDEGLQALIIRASEKRQIEVIAGGIYIQTPGPRLETKAEIDILKLFGDIVGMTMAHEATLASELDIAYASICSVDNFCHGIVDVPLQQEEIAKTARQNATTVKALIHAILEELG